MTSEPAPDWTSGSSFLLTGLEGTDFLACLLGLPPLSFPVELLRPSPFQSSFFASSPVFLGIKVYLYPILRDKIPVFWAEVINKYQSILSKNQFDLTVRKDERFLLDLDLLLSIHSTVNTPYSWEFTLSQSSTLSSFFLFLFSSRFLLSLLNLLVSQFRHLSLCNADMNRKEMVRIPSTHRKHCEKTFTRRFYWKHKET